MSGNNKVKACYVKAGGKWTISGCDSKRKINSDVWLMNNPDNKRTLDEFKETAAFKQLCKKHFGTDSCGYERAPGERGQWYFVKNVGQKKMIIPVMPEPPKKDIRGQFDWLVNLKLRRMNQDIGRAEHARLEKKALDNLEDVFSKKHKEIKQTCINILDEIKLLSKPRTLEEFKRRSAMLDTLKGVIGLFKEKEDKDDRLELAQKYEEMIKELDESYEVSKKGQSCGEVPTAPYKNSCQSNQNIPREGYLNKKYQLDFQKYVYVDIRELALVPEKDKSGRRTRYVFDYVLPFKPVEQIDQKTTLNFNADDLLGINQYIPALYDSEVKDKYSRLNSLLRREYRETHTGEFKSISQFESGGYKYVGFLPPKTVDDLPRVFLYKKRYSRSLAFALFNHYSQKHQMPISTSVIHASPYEIAALVELFKIPQQNLCLTSDKGINTFNVCSDAKCSQDQLDLKKLYPYYFTRDTNDVKTLYKKIDKNIKKLAELYLKFEEEQTGRKLVGTAREKALEEASSRFTRLSWSLFDRGDLLAQRWTTGLTVGGILVFPIIAVGWPLVKEHAVDRLIAAKKASGEKASRMMNDEYAKSYQEQKIGENLKHSGRESVVTEGLGFFNNPERKHAIYHGGSGHGKDDAVLRVLKMVAAGDKRVPKEFRKAEIFKVDASEFQANTEYRGAVATKLREILSYPSKGKNAIIYIPEIDKILLSGSVSSGDAEQVAGLLLEILTTKKNIVFIGSTSRRAALLESCPDLLRRFHWLKVEQLSFEEVTTSLKYDVEFNKGARTSYNVAYTHDQIEFAARLTEKYIREFGQNDKAKARFDAIKEVVFAALDKAKNAGHSRLSDEHILSAVRDKTRSIDGNVARVPSAVEDARKAVLDDKSWRIELLREGRKGDYLTELRSVLGTKNVDISNVDEMLFKIQVAIGNGLVKNKIKPEIANWLSLGLLSRWLKTDRFTRSLYYMKDNANVEVNLLLPPQAFIEDYVGKVALELVENNVVAEKELPEDLKSKVKQARTGQGKSVISERMITKVREFIVQQLLDHGRTSSPEVIENWTRYASSLLETGAKLDAIKPKLNEVISQGGNVANLDGSWLVIERPYVDVDVIVENLRRTFKSLNKSIPHDGELRDLARFIISKAQPADYCKVEEGKFNNEFHKRIGSEISDIIKSDKKVMFDAVKNQWIMIEKTASPEQFETKVKNLEKYGDYKQEVFKALTKKEVYNAIFKNGWLTWVMQRRYREINAFIGKNLVSSDSPVLKEVARYVFNVWIMAPSDLKSNYIGKKSSVGESFPPPEFIRDIGRYALSIMIDAGNRVGYLKAINNVQETNVIKILTEEGKLSGDDANDSRAKGAVRKGDGSAARRRTHSKTDGPRESHSHKPVGKLRAEKDRTRRANYSSAKAARNEAMVPNNWYVPDRPLGQMDVSNVQTDPNGNVVMRLNPADRGEVTYRYDKKGRVVLSTRPDGMNLTRGKTPPRNSASFVRFAREQQIPVNATDQNLERFYNTTRNGLLWRDFKVASFGGMTAFIPHLFMDGMKKPGRTHFASLGTMHLTNATLYALSDAMKKAMMRGGQIIPMDAGKLKVFLKSFGHHLANVRGLGAGIIVCYPGAKAGELVVEIFTSNPIAKTVGSVVGAGGLPIAVRFIAGKSTRLARYLASRPAALATKAMSYVGWPLLVKDMVQGLYEDSMRQNMTRKQVELRTEALRLLGPKASFIFSFEFMHNLAKVGSDGFVCKTYEYMIKEVEKRIAEKKPVDPKTLQGMLDKHIERLKSIFGQVHPDFMRGSFNPFQIN